MKFFLVLLYIIVRTLVAENIIFIIDLLCGFITYSWFLRDINDIKFFSIMFNLTKPAEDMRRRELRLRLLLDLLKNNYTYVFKFIPEIELPLLEFEYFISQNSNFEYPTIKLFNYYNGNIIDKRINYLHTGSIYYNHDFYIMIYNKFENQKWKKIKMMKEALVIKICI